MSARGQSIREIITVHPSAAGVFQRFGIDLCSQTELSVDQACAQLQLSVDQVLEKLEDAKSKEPGSPTVEPANLSMARLIQHIVRVHHQCVRRELPGLAEMAGELAAKRGKRAPELQEIEWLVEELRADMLDHIQKEEQVLFPLISQMDQESIVACAGLHECSCSVAQPVFMMLQDHEAADHVMAELRRLTHGFQPPEWACAMHRALFSGLRAFDIDLTQHMHLENDILFPRSIAMEAGLNRRG